MKHTLASALIGLILSASLFAEPEETIEIRLAASPTPDFPRNVARPSNVPPNT
ncbi:MAG: hypothetical protein ABJF10_05950 [Chthoniobacter sp.]|uniref:hypothetical protein n=1 Tax=Chthoniobacter sp. TaxID=2510640 RepID=UPI0032AA1821